MENAIGFEAAPVSGDGSGLAVRGRGGAVNGMARLLDAMPWWVLVIHAILTFLLLHQIAIADVEQISRAAANQDLASQVIIKILAGAGQYLFPVMMVGEAIVAVIASRRVTPRSARRARNTATTVTCEEPGLAVLDGVKDELSSPKAREEIPAAQRVWSPALLNRISAQRFEALAAQYYGEEGIRCEPMPFGRAGATVLKLFHGNSDKASVAVQFPTRGTPWVGADQIRGLRQVMNGEGIVKGFFMTSGSYCDEAKAFARSNNITLIDATLFVVMIKRLPQEARDRLLGFATKGD